MECCHYVNILAWFTPPNRLELRSPTFFVGSPPATLTADTKPQLAKSPALAASNPLARPTVPDHILALVVGLTGHFLQTGSATGNVGATVTNSRLSRSTFSIMSSAFAGRELVIATQEAPTSFVCRFALLGDISLALEEAESIQHAPGRVRVSLRSLALLRLHRRVGGLRLVSACMQAGESV